MATATEALELLANVVDCDDEEVIQSCQVLLAELATNVNFQRVKLSIRELELLNDLGETYNEFREGLESEEEESGSEEDEFDIVPNGVEEEDLDQEEKDIS